MTTETTETIIQPTEQIEVKNSAGLIAKNKELLRELADTKAALQAAQDALGTAQSDKSAMSDRWYRLAVLEPLEADLSSASAAPWKYLRDTALEKGLLKMEPDSEGFERPAWFNEKGEPADLSNGLYKFLCGVYSRGGKDHELGSVLRASGASGSGSTGSSGHGVSQNASPVPTPVAPIPLGLR